MGKKNRAKQSGKPGGAMLRHKKELVKMAADLFKLCVMSPSTQDEWEYYLKVHTAVENFSQKQKNVSDPPVVQPIDRTTAIPKFKSWLKEHGVEYSAIDIQEVSEEEGFGVIALQDIEIKCPLVTIPRKAMMTYEDAKSSYLAGLIEGNEVLSVMPNVCLALYLHCERFTLNSKYQPYIDMIPQEFNTILYFKPHEMKYLKGTAALSVAINQFKSIVRQFALLYQVFNGSHQKEDVEKLPLQARNAFTFDTYRWCASAVTTRQNKIPTHVGDVLGDLDENSTLALIPMWDMFNHAIGPLSTAYNALTRGIECLAMQDFKTGEQVKICYGARTNSDLLIHNGFVMKESPFDKVRIHLGVSQKDPLYSLKAKLLEKLNVEVSGQFAVCSMDNSLPTSPQLLVFLRVFHMNEEELRSWLEKQKNELSSLREIYISGEVKFKSDVKVWEFLENRVKLLLMGFKKIGDNIEEMMEDKSLTHRSKLALQFRIEEHRILSACVNFCRQIRNALENRSSGELMEDSVVMYTNKNPSQLEEEKDSTTLESEGQDGAKGLNVDINKIDINANNSVEEISHDPDTWVYD
uniref:histone-lysine N-methyltransferase setd3 n=1 Tax=Ciona intestinalis TaxID=7719 RepID=UPI000180B020|nr:histone-lysine N-methyltransferase setd3 [Ciona intestinalis]|eukprot:XP_002131202.1 histone-lysine N-methyltransferase setd3 [Ciona intestinalis]